MKKINFKIELINFSITLIFFILLNSINQYSFLSYLAGGIGFYIYSNLKEKK